MMRSAGYSSSELSVPFRRSRGAWYRFPYLIVMPGIRGPVYAALQSRKETPWQPEP